MVRRGHQGPAPSHQNSPALCYSGHTVDSCLGPASWDRHTSGRRDLRTKRSQENRVSNPFVGMASGYRDSRDDHRSLKNWTCVNSCGSPWNLDTWSSPGVTWRHSDGLLRACDSLSLVLSTDRSREVQDSPTHLRLCTCTYTRVWAHSVNTERTSCLSGDIEESSLGVERSAHGRARPLVHFLS